MPASNNYIGNHDFLTYSSVFDLTNVVFVCGWAKTASEGDYSFQDMLKRTRAVLTELHKVLACYPKILNVGINYRTKGSLNQHLPVLGFDFFL